MTLQATPQARLPLMGMRIPFYYGWVVLGLAALAMVGTLPGRTQGLGLITEGLLQDLSLDRVEFAQMNLWATLIGSLGCIGVGRWFDRAGSRVMLPLMAALLGAVVLAMSRTHSVTVLLVLLGHRGDVRAVAFVDAVGDVEGGFEAEMTELDQEEGRRGAAVDIVVGEDRDPLASGDGLEEAVSGGGHVLQGEGVGHQVAERGGKKGETLLLQLPQQHRELGIGSEAACVGKPAVAGGLGAELRAIAIP